MAKIIENGLNSIRVGLEDYETAIETENDARLTSAVRNVFAGINILAKGKLDELSPADTPSILIYVVRPQLVNGRIELVRDGRKTIGYEEIKQRFGQFGLSLDWKRIERIRAIRNDLEHLYHDGARSNVQEALADTAMIVRSLLTLLKLDPVRDLGERWWAVLLKNEKLFAVELAACRETFSAVRWINEAAAAATRHFSCDQCDSPLIRQADPSNHQQDDACVVCGACGAESDVKAILERATTKRFFRGMYESQTQGGEPPVVRCPKCYMYALVIDANECAVCGTVLSASTEWCDNCQNPMTADERLTGSHQCPAFFQA